MTKDAIRQAFGHLRPGSELAPLEAAARSRSEADWLVGMNATRAATIRGRAAFGSTRRLARPRADADARDPGAAREGDPGLRAQAVLARRRDVPARADKTAYRGRHVRGSRDAHRDRPRTPTRSSRASRTARGTSPRSRKRTQRSQPPLLYDLTALQREAASWHGFTARRTLSAAQGCYEKAVLTYPRTASRYLSSDMIPELKEIAGHVGKRSKEYAQGRRLRAGPGRAAARAHRQQREGHGPPRDHPDERARRRASS